MRATSPSAPPKPQPPGARRARHQRWVKIATATTVLSVAGFVVWLVFEASPAASPEVARTDQARRFLAGIAAQVEAFVGRRNRLPDTLFELKTPDSESPYDPDPHDVWDRLVEYRVVDPVARAFRLRSTGPDRTPDTPDDLVWPPGTTWR